jgi:methyl-accepting chemotaxis protein
MNPSARKTEEAFRLASRRLLGKVLLSAVAIPLATLALFSLTIFRFSSRQYTAFLLAAATVVLPLVILLALVYRPLQRRLLQRILSWYREPKQADNPFHRAQAVAVQRAIHRSAYLHGFLVSLGIFLSFALGAAFYGGMAEFTPSMYVYYLSLGLVLAMVDFLVTVFISQQEMRRVMELFLSHCRGFGFHQGVSLGKRLVLFSSLLLLLVIGVTWIAFAYESADLLREEKTADFQSAASRLAGVVDGTPEAEDPEILEDILFRHAGGGDSFLAVLREDRTILAGVSTGEPPEDGWDAILASLPPQGEDGPSGGTLRAGSCEYLYSSSPLEAGEGRRLVEIRRLNTTSVVLRRIAPSMILLLLLAVFVAAYLTYLLSHDLVIPLRRLVTASRRVGKGDLTVTVTVDSLDETGELSTAYDEMISSLRKISGDLKISSAEVSSEADGVASLSEEIMAAVEELNSLVEELSEAVQEEVERIEEVGRVSAQVSETISTAHAHASLSRDISSEAEKEVEEGRSCARSSVEKIADLKEILDRSLSALSSLAESSRKISSIVDIIEGISDQTKLLALNAAIEAARVPEYGKGFAVVADEVKKLAQESSASAQQIHLLVQGIQEEVERVGELMEEGNKRMAEGMDMVERTDHSLSSLFSKINRVAGVADETARSTERELEESGRLLQLLASIRERVENNSGAYQELAASTEQQARAVTELASAAGKLSDIAHQLLDLVEKFHLPE